MDSLDVNVTNFTNKKCIERLLQFQENYYPMQNGSAPTSWRASLDRLTKNKLTVYANLSEFGLRQTTFIDAITPKGKYLKNVIFSSSGSPILINLFR